ncbi:MAG: DNA helicase, partial [Nitrosomonadales bacterium]
HPAIPALLTGAAAAAAPGVFGDAEARPPEHGNLEANCGTLAHLYMEMIADEGLEGWSAQRINALHAAMQRWLMQQGHAEAEALNGARRVAAALCTTLDSEAGRWVLRARESAASELALATADGARIATHIVDRTFVEDGVRWIIDYKSARLGDAMAGDVLEQQAERYRPQLERYAQLFGAELPIRKVVFFLAHGRLVTLG